MIRLINFLFYILLCGLIVGCIKEDISDLNEKVLSDYILLNNDRERADIIACAAGRENGLSGSSDFSTAIFYYPIAGATDFKYFEASNVSDSLNFDKYIQKDLGYEPIFNGYLAKFNLNDIVEDKMCVVTYKTPGNLHVCTPIRIKTNTKPTEVNNSLLTIMDNGTSPSFVWEDGQIDENVIFFQVISDEDNNLVSGTYTIDNNFTFYDLSNVVLNITDEGSNPILLPNRTYTFTLMGVSEDNWVNLFIEKTFETD